MLQLVIKVPITVRSGRSVGLHLTQQLAAGTNATAALCFVVDQGATVYDSAVSVADHRSFVLLELCNAHVWMPRRQNLMLAAMSLDRVK